MSISRSKAARADTLVSGRLISEVGRGGEISTAVFIVQRFLLQFLESLTLAPRDARASMPVGTIRRGEPTNFPSAVVRADRETDIRHDERTLVSRHALFVFR